MSAPGTPKASEAAIAAVQDALGCERHATIGCADAVAAADAARGADAPRIAAKALRDAATDFRGFDAIRTHGDATRWLRDRADRIEVT